MSTTDPDFGQMTYNGIDAWDCSVECDFPHRNSRCFAIHIWAPDTGPTTAQRSRFRQLRARYNDLWPEIARRIAAVHPELDSAEDVSRVTSEWVAVHLGEHDEQSVELVYDLAIPGEDGRAYFIPLDGWAPQEAVVAQ